MIHGNSAPGMGGGGINSSGTMTLINVVMVGNTADHGEAIDEHSGTLTLINTTITGNSASVCGGVWQGGAIALQNSIVAGNTDVYGILMCSTSLPSSLPARTT